MEMGRTDRGIMKLLTSKQAAESSADGRADGEGAARLGCERDNQPDFSWMLRKKVAVLGSTACVWEGLEARLQPFM